eukprot:scaffold270390_cov24-Tisochrysis_lutea.AAC.2
MPLDTWREDKMHVPRGAVLRQGRPHIQAQFHNAVNCAQDRRDRIRPSIKGDCIRSTPLRRQFR